MRIVYILLFCVVFSFTDILLFLIALLQSIKYVVTGESSATLKDFGTRLGVYLKQIADFVSFSSDEKPFPFSDWPESSAVEHSALNEQDKQR